MLLNDSGVDLSAFLTIALPVFLDLPEDPTERLIKLRVRSSAIRVRSTYINELRDRSTELRDRIAEEEEEIAAQQAAEAPFIEFGQLLQKTSQYPQALVALQTMRHEAPCWDIILDELNSMDGRTWEWSEMWNTAIEWYRRYGLKSHATV